MNSPTPSKRNKSNVNASVKKSIGVNYDLSSPDYALPFFVYLTIPKNTPIDTPYEFNLKLPVGVVHRIWTEFPRGCSGLAGVQVWRNPRQIFPLPEGVWLRSDNAILNFAFTHNVLTDPFEVTFKAYNLDDTYEHTIWLSLEMRGKAADLSPSMRAFLQTLK